MTETETTRFCNVYDLRSDRWTNLGLPGIVIGATEDWLVARPFEHVEDLELNGDGVQDAGVSFLVDFRRIDDPAPRRFNPGDANDDGRIDLSDAVRILGTLFLGDDPLPCLDAANANGDPRVDVSDAVFILGHLFLGQDPGLPDASCSGIVGRIDPGCASYSACDVAPLLHEP